MSSRATKPYLYKLMQANVLTKTRLDTRSSSLAFLELPLTLVACMAVHLSVTSKSAYARWALDAKDLKRELSLLEGE